MTQKMLMSCVGCGKPFEAKRARAKYCGGACKQRVLKQARANSSTPMAPARYRATKRGPEGSITAAVERELAAAGRAETVLGQTALRLAAKLDDAGFDTGSAVASVARELRATMVEALAGAPKAETRLDELRERRDRRRGA